MKLTHSADLRDRSVAEIRRREPQDLRVRGQVASGGKPPDNVTGSAGLRPYLAAGRGWGES